MAKTDTQISLRVTSQFKARLERQAERERRSVSNLILKVMEEYLEQEEEKENSGSHSRTEQPGACAVYAGLWLFCFLPSLPSSPGGTQTRPPSCPAVIRPSSAKGRLSFQPVGDGLAPPAVPSCCGPPETL